MARSSITVFTFSISAEARSSSAAAAASAFLRAVISWRFAFTAVSRFLSSVDEMSFSFIRLFASESSVSRRESSVSAAALWAWMRSLAAPADFFCASALFRVAMVSLSSRTAMTSPFFTMSPRSAFISTIFPGYLLCTV